MTTYQLPFHKASQMTSGLCKRGQTSLEGSETWHTFSFLLNVLLNFCFVWSLGNETPKIWAALLYLLPTCCLTQAYKFDLFSRLRCGVCGLAETLSFCHKASGLRIKMICLAKILMSLRKKVSFRRK